MVSLIFSKLLSNNSLLNSKLLIIDGYTRGEIDCEDSEPIDDRSIPARDAIFPKDPETLKDEFVSGMNIVFDVYLFLIINDTTTPRKEKIKIYFIKINFCSITVLITVIISLSISFKIAYLII